MLASDGARPSQLNTRFSSVASPALRPALRWIAISPMLAPAPASSAATHSSGVVRAAEPRRRHRQHAAGDVSPTASRSGRW